MATLDVAIYAPFAAPLYERAGGSWGGAEQQTFMLARALAAKGVRTGQIVFPVQDPVSDGVALIERRPWRGDRRLVGKLSEARDIWSAMAAADARVYVVRSSGIHVAMAAAFCRARGRRLVFSSSHVMDFTFDAVGPETRNVALYRSGVRIANAVVVQTKEQLILARTAFPRLRRLERIPSFAAEAPPVSSRPDAFVWVGRLNDYKRPLEFVELARAVPEARFRMVGVDGSLADPGLLAEVNGRAESVENLELLPRLPHEGVLALIHGSVAVVNTSLAEGMPNVFLEAWARGVPALSLTTDPDGVIAGEGIGMVAQGSMKRLAGAARTMWTDARLRQRMGEAARRYVRREHGQRRVADRWHRLLASLTE
jgi:glycosyltransferase involved in cell wall biosynthesis